MKFSQNTSVMEPNTINAQARVVSDPMAYGTGGKGLAGLSGALGQAIKFAKDQQDDRDAAKVLEGRTEIINALNQQLYGEDGIMITGVGKNAQGLSDRVTKTIQDTVDKISRNYNPRVQKTLKNNLSEPLSGYQKQAIQQEGREFEKQKDTDLTSNLSFNYDRIIANYAEDGTISMTLNDSLNLLQYRARDKGWSGMQLATEQRKLVGTMIGGAIQAAIDDGNLPKAGEILNTYGSMMDQTTRMKYNGIIKKDTNIRMTIDMGGEVLKNCGKDKNAAHKYVYEYLAKQTETVSGGGFSNDRFARIAQKTAAIIRQKYPDASPNLEAYLYGQMMHETGWGKDPIALEYNNFAGLHGGAKGRKYADDDEYAKDYASFFTDGYHTNAIYATDGMDFARRLSNKLDGGSGWYTDRNYQAYGNTVQKAMGDYNEKAKQSNGPAAVKPYQMPTQGGNIDAQVNNLQDKWKHGVMDYVGGVLTNVFGYSNPTISSAARSAQRNSEVSTSGNRSWHVHNDALDIVFDEGQNLNQAQKDKLVQYFKNTGMFEEVLYHNFGSGWHLHLGGLKSSKPPTGGSTYTKPKYTQAQLDAIWRQYEAQLTDSVQTEEYAKKQELEAVRSQIENTSSSSEALAILQRLRATPGTDTSKLDVAIHAINSKYPGAVSSSRGGTGTGGGSRRTKEKIHGVNGYNGVSGKWYTKEQYDKDNEIARIYNEHVDLQNKGLYKISSEEQNNAMAASRRLNDVWNNNYDDDGIASAAAAYKEAHGDILDAINILVKKGIMDNQAEAARYVNKYLEYTKQED